MECRFMLRPPLVRLRFRLWLPILRNAARHLTMSHFPFSSSRNRSGRRDFNPCIDMLIFCSNVLFVYLSLLCFKARVTDLGLLREIRGIRSMLKAFIVRSVYWNCLFNSGARCRKTKIFMPYYPQLIKDACLNNILF